MKPYYAYIRVSTPRQGEGVSFEAQRDVIEAHARAHNFTISEWFTEKKTAAKRGRTVFNHMLALLKQGKAGGVIIHKVDRSARNLRDWADMGELIDAGIDVQFANEKLDLRTRGGRLSADIQAIVAADFIRNHREEVKKGFYGRLKQGFYPLPAPIGYRDNGKAKAKTIDPVAGPLVRRAFQLYATCEYNLNTLSETLYRMGLQNRHGARLGDSPLAKILHSEFYMGIIHIRRTEERFRGLHEPLIPKSLFDAVQRVMRGKARSTGWKHDFLYRRAIRCGACRRALVGERQKGIVYYRCHARSCIANSVREDVVSKQVHSALASLQLTPAELDDLAARIYARKDREEEDRQRTLQTQRIALAKLNERFTRLTDMYMDAMIDKETFERRKQALLSEQLSTEERMTELQQGRNTLLMRAQEKLELLRTLSLRGFTANPAEELDLLLSASSNLAVQEKRLLPAWSFGFDVIANRTMVNDGGASQATARMPGQQLLPLKTLPWVDTFIERVGEGVLLKLRGSLEVAQRSAKSCNKHCENY